jgi:hypothetical protein
VSSGHWVGYRLASIEGLLLADSVEKVGHGFRSKKVCA